MATLAAPSAAAIALAWLRSSGRARVGVGEAQDGHDGQRADRDEHEGQHERGAPVVVPSRPQAPVYWSCLPPHPGQRHRGRDGVLRMPDAHGDRHLPRNGGTDAGAGTRHAHRRAGRGDQVVHHDSPASAGVGESPGVPRVHRPMAVSRQLEFTADGAHEIGGRDDRGSPWRSPGCSSQGDHVRAGAAALERVDGLLQRQRRRVQSRTPRFRTSSAKNAVATWMSCDSLIRRVVASVLRTYPIRASLSGTMMMARIVTATRTSGKVTPRSSHIKRRLRSLNIQQFKRRLRSLNIQRLQVHSASVGRQGLRMMIVRASLTRPSMLRTHNVTC